ncbi:MAG: POTRA domain-containing protein [bacterium]
MLDRNLYSFIFLLTFSSILHSQSIYLNIRGEDSISSKIIEDFKYQEKHNSYESLDEELLNYQQKLINQGYFELRRTYFDKINDSTYRSNFYLGAKIDTIYIYQPKNVKNVKNHSSVEEGYIKVRVATSELELYLKNLVKEFASEGFPFASVQLKNISRIENTISAYLKINLGESRTIDEIVIKGYEKFPRSFLKHYLKLKEGNSFNKEEVEEKLLKLKDLNFATSSRDPELLFTEDSTKLYLYLNKSTSNNFDGFLGFGTNEETNNLEFDGYLNLLLTNNLNFGERFFLSYKSDEIDQQTFLVDLELPFLFNSPLGVRTDLKIFRKDSSFTTTTQNLKLVYTLNSKWNISAGIRSSSSNNLLDNTSSGTLPEIDDFSSFQYTITSQWQTLQNEQPLFPIKTRFVGEIGFGNRDGTSLNSSQNTFGIKAMNIFNFNKRNSIYLNADSRILLSDNFFDNELYRFGGITSIRGFEENSLVANIYGVLNTEYRYQLSSSIYAHTIIDLGYFQNDLTDVNQKLFGVGFGLGILTNAGLLKFNYANGNFEGQNFRLSDSKIHLSLNATF